MNRLEHLKQKQNLIIMMNQIENLLKFSENNESGVYLTQRLSPCYYELKRQLHCLNHVEVDNTESSV